MLTAGYLVVSTGFKAEFIFYCICQDRKLEILDLVQSSLFRVLSVPDIKY